MLEIASDSLANGGDPAMAASVAEAVRYAIAPIFLLFATAGLLNAMTLRLGRVVDRARVLEERIEDVPERLDKYRSELIMLERRMVSSNRAVTACVISCIVVCFMVGILFCGALFNVPVRLPIGVLFMVVTVTLIVGVSFFLREILLGNASLHVRQEWLRNSND